MGNNKPLFSERVGTLQFAIWKTPYNSTSITLSHPYKDADGKMQNGQSLTASDLINLYYLCPDLIEKMRSYEKKLKAKLAEEKADAKSDDWDF